MSTEWHEIKNYRIGTGAKNCDGVVYLYGDGFFGFLKFYKEGPPHDSKATTIGTGPYTRRFDGYVDHSQLALYVDLLRNEKPVNFYWLKADPNVFQLLTGLEPVGEEESFLAEAGAYA